MRTKFKKIHFFSFFLLITVILVLSQACHQMHDNRQKPQQVKRVGSVIRIKPEKLTEYKELHRNVWPEVNAILTDCNIHNYSIYYKDGYLFSYFEYTGNNYAADMKKMADDPITKKWWKLTDPLQTPLESRKEGEWWAEMEEVYHLE